jgi:uncharacterized membrane protein YgcG
MNRAALSLALGSIVVLGALGPAGIAAAAPVTPVRDAASVTTGVQDFEFASYSADFYLDRDSGGHSTLKTVETFVATFPDIPQNHGMKRAIPMDYLGAPTDLSFESVTDGNGNPRPFTTETDDNGFLVVTSREDNFVHGNQTYVFTYTQRNVTRLFEDTNKDEFYWDTNGTGFLQPFGTVSARVHVPAALSEALVPGESCYQGAEKSTDKCPIERAADADGQVFTVAVEGIGPGQNVTVVVPFKANTFVPRDSSFFGSPLGFIQLGTMLVSFFALVWAIVLRRTRLADAPGRPTIIAEYSPPAGLDVVTAAVILKKTSRAAAAEILDLAVTRKIRLLDAISQGFFSKKEVFTLELLDSSELTGPARDLAKAIFGEGLVGGTRYTISSSDTTLSAKVRSLIQRATNATTSDGLRKRGTAKYGVGAALVAMLAATGAILTGVGLLNGSLGGAVPFLLFIPPVIVLVIVFALVARTPLTAEGSELRDHLKGLELYIRLAEADRLKMLQSPTGAERTQAPGDDPSQVVKVYEKLLPYAVLFSLEREWAVELGKYYTEASPDWYSGSGPFNAVLFASGISGLSTTAASSYSGSSSSSSSGGSGGGGFSGGGGGGGGGGGV